MIDVIDMIWILVLLWFVMLVLVVGGVELVVCIWQGGDLVVQVGINVDGDGQKVLDVIVDDLFWVCLIVVGLWFYVFEEQDQVLELNFVGGLVLVIDLLDGLLNIDINLIIGMIFFIYFVVDMVKDSFLCFVCQQIGVGYIIYGLCCVMMVIFGDGVQYYVLGFDGFWLVDVCVIMFDCLFEFVINVLNYWYWL